MTGITNANNKFVPQIVDNVLEPTYEAYTFPLPVDEYTSDTFWSTVGGLFIFFVLIQFMYPINIVVSVLVTEKADKIAEGLKMMGATLFSYWFSWISWWFMEYTFIALSVTLFAVVGQVFKYSDIVVIFLWFWGFCLSLSGLAILMSTS